jgi:hypothetical protein
MLIHTLAAGALTLGLASAPPSDDQFIAEAGDAYLADIDAITMMTDAAILALEGGDFRGASEIALTISLEWDGLATDVAERESGASLAGGVTGAVFQVCAATWADASSALDTLDADQLTRAADAMDYCAKGAELLAGSYFRE